MGSISLNPATLLSGQGIDVTSLVNQILSNQSGPLQLWEQQQADLSTQEGLLLGINNNLTNLQTAVQSLTDPLGPLSAIAATSSQPDILTASVQSSATVGTHQIVVNNLASAGALFTDPVADPAASFLTDSGQNGQIGLEIGGVTQNLTITAGSNDTLNSLASYINTQSQSNNWGVTASIINDASGSRLAIFSQATGSPGALAITSNTNSNLNFNPPVGGVDASVTVDGVPYTSTSNTLTGAIPGVTLNLLSSSPNTPVTLSVGVDPTQVTQAINNFVSAYNTILGNINQQYAVDPTNNTEGPLGSDLSLRSLQSSLLNDMTYTLPGGTSMTPPNGGLVNLAALGISTNDDGTLSVDNTQLSDLLASNPSGVIGFFQNSSSTGFANSFQGDLANLTDPTVGPLSVEIAQNQAEQQDLTNNITNFESQLTQQQTQLTQQYSQVNAELESYPLLLQEVTESIGSLSTLATGGVSNTTSTASPILTAGL